MARIVARLTEQKIRALTKRGLYGDGGGLYVQVRENGVRSWIFRFTLNGRTRDAGLGSLADVGLVAARAKAAEYRALCAKAIDPIEHQRAEGAAAAVKIAPSSTAPLFKDYAEAFIVAREPDWKNQKLAGLWRSTLETYAFPVIGDLPVDAIETRQVLEILKPIWREKSETATRVRERIERILAAASVEGLRVSNPAVFERGEPWEEAQGGALCGAAPCRSSFVHGEAAPARHRLCPRAGIHDLESRPLRRSAGDR